MESSFTIDNNFKKQYFQRKKTKLSSEKHILDNNKTNDNSFIGWKIFCDNAGALLKGLGFYNYMRSGNLNILINFDKNNNKKEIQGLFDINRFVIEKNNSLLNLISYVSIPGFINIIRGNNIIPFANFAGEFIICENKIKVKNGRANSPYFDIKLGGDILYKDKFIDIKGDIIPSFYGIGKVVKYIPLLNYIMINKGGSGIISNKYEIRTNY
ncbi:MAG TPA: hypothetical protein QKA14_00670 [Candidatus Megaira endosymbiont of Hartmannula sinica]|nr:hypothetical protein [Candidatus Megaera endosymbiont of Hartmannula sinica]